MLLLGFFAFLAWHWAVFCGLGRNGFWTDHQGLGFAYWSAGMVAHWTALAFALDALGVTVSA